MNKVEREIEFDEMRLYFDANCWRCKRSRKPDWFHGPWFLHRAHIVNQPRLRDRRCVILLCPVCHDVSHGGDYSHYGWPVKEISVEEMIALKREIDPEYYDPDLLQACSVRRLSL